MSVTIIMFWFIGKPGAGKSTLLKQLNVQSQDVIDYVKRFFDKSGKLINESDAKKAYELFFSEVSADYIELGTNYPEFVISSIKRIDPHAIVFLCILSEEECLKRCTVRGRKMGTEQLMRRIKRTFPDEHIKHLNELNVKYVIVDMNRPVSEIVKDVTAHL